MTEITPFLPILMLRGGAFCSLDSLGRAGALPLSERFFFLLCARRECGGGVALGAQRVALLEDGPVRGDGAQRLGEGRVLCELLLGARESCPSKKKNL